MRAWCCLLWLCGCAAHEAPASRVHTVAGVRVAFRAWPPSQICEAEPRFLLDELTAVNSGLQRYLDAARSDAPADWPERRIRAVEALAEGLDEVVTQHETNVKGVAACGFAASAGYPFVRTRGLELIREVRERRTQLPERFAAARLERARDEWSRSLPSLRESARSACPTRTAAPQVFFAWADDEGTHWWFCDGAQLVRPAAPEEAELDLLVKDTPRGQRAFTRQQYLDVAAGFPVERLSMAPRRG